MAHEIINENYVSGTDEFINFKEVKNILREHLDGRGYGVQSLWSVITFQVWYKKFISN